MHWAFKINIEKQFFEIDIQESNWINGLCQKKLGSSKESVLNFEKYEVYTKESHNTKNLHHFKNTKIRVCTEPDIKWWKENIKVDYEQINTYDIKTLSNSLKKT